MVQNLESHPGELTVLTLTGKLATGLQVSGGGGGTPENSWWGCAVRFSKSQPYFGPKNVREQ